MKKILVITICCLEMSGILNAQPGKPTTGKPATAPVVLKNMIDSASYAMGCGFANVYKQQGTTKVNTSQIIKAINDVYGTDKTDSASYAIGLGFANFYKQQGITKINTAMISRGINDVFGGKKTILDANTANSIINNYITQVHLQKSRPAIDSGEAFLRKNKLKTGVKTTSTGLQYEVITEGTGPKPTAADSVTCHYKGSLLNGTVFDDSYSRGQPITFALKGVIPGWTEGLQLMSTGSKYRFYIPYTLGYGAFDYGPIPGGSMLTFDVELLEVKK